MDRLVIREGIGKRLTDSLEQALSEGGSLVYVEVQEPEHAQTETLHFSENFSCPDCGISIEEIEPRSFSFNNPFGACPECTGLGYRMEFDDELMIPDRSLSIDEGAIIVPGWQSAREEGSFSRSVLDALAEEYHFSLSTPFEDYPPQIQKVLLTGTDDLGEGSRILGEYGISLIMITLGSEGVFYRCKGNSGEGDLHGIVPAEEVSVCDTNGAGDTFLGAVLAQIANNGSIPAERVQLEAMLTFANRAAALTCSRPGAIPAMPTLAELGEK